MFFAFFYVFFPLIFLLFGRFNICAHYHATTQGKGRMKRNEKIHFIKTRKRKRERERMNLPCNLIKCDNEKRKDNLGEL